jgi:hypothetical protein
LSQPPQPVREPQHAAPKGEGQSPASDVDQIAIAPVIWTTLICALIAGGGHAVLWLSRSLGWTVPSSEGAVIPWQPVTGIVLVLVAIIAFGGFYIAARRARVAISASFLLTFLVALSYVLTLQGLAEATQAGGAKEIFNDFRTVVIVIIGFYFGTEALVSAAKIIGAALTHNDPKIIQRADRDLGPPARGVK